MMHLGLKAKVETLQNKFSKVATKLDELREKEIER